MEIEYTDDAGETKKLDIPDVAYNKIKGEGFDKATQETLSRYNDKIRTMFEDHLKDAPENAKVVDLLNEIKGKFTAPSNGGSDDDSLELKKINSELQQKLEEMQASSETRVKEIETLSRIKAFALGAGLKPEFEGDIDEQIRKFVSTEIDSKGRVVLLDKEERVINGEGDKSPEKQALEMIMKAKPSMFKERKGGAGLDGNSGGNFNTKEPMPLTANTEDIFRAAIKL